MPKCVSAKLDALLKKNLTQSHLPLCVVTWDSSCVCQHGHGMGPQFSYQFNNLMVYTDFMMCTEKCGVFIEN